MSSLVILSSDSMAWVWSMPLLFVVVVPQLVCLSKPAPMRKSRQLAAECLRSSVLLTLCCALMCVSAGQWVIMCVRLWVLVLQCVQTSSTESSILFQEVARAVWCRKRNLLRCTRSARGSASSEWRISLEEYLILCWDRIFVWLCLWSACGCVD